MEEAAMQMPHPATQQTLAWKYREMKQIIGYGLHVARNLSIDSSAVKTMLAHLP